MEIVNQRCFIVESEMGWPTRRKPVWETKGKCIDFC